MILAAFALAWWCVGFGSFVYWWTKDYDLNTKELVVGVFLGVVGPINFLIGYMIHGYTPKPQKTWIKRRWR